MHTVHHANFPKKPVGSRWKIHSRTVPRVVPLSLGADAPDETLIKAIARRDRHAMELLYARHSVRTYRFVKRIIGDATLAEDIVSEVFRDIWQHANGFKSKPQISTRLLAIARAKTYSALRRRSDAQRDDHGVITASDSAVDPDILVHNAERRAVIRKCLAQLPASQRELFDLVYYHEKSVNEVAQIVGTPASIIRSRILRARHRMQGFLKVVDSKVPDRGPRSANPQN